jgi:ribosomal protein S18 acetylase RimI-like enzyme
VEEAARFRVRPGRRSDAAAIGELRVRHLGETARLDPRLRTAEGARERIAHAPATWLSQDERCVFVALDAAAPEEESQALLGYACGLLSVWPPIWAARRVGEVTEAFVVPDRRGQGAGRALLRAVALDLSDRGAEVLRAPVPARNPWAVSLFRSLGFDPVQTVLELAAPKGE